MSCRQMSDLFQIEYVCYRTFLKCRCIRTQVEVCVKRSLSCCLPKGLVGYCGALCSGYSLLDVTIIVYPDLYYHLT